MLHKILNGYVNSDFSNLYTFSTTSTRGHDTILNFLSINQDYYAGQTISSIE